MCPDSAYALSFADLIGDARGLASAIRVRLLIAVRRMSRRFSKVDRPMRLVPGVPAMRRHSAIPVSAENELIVSFP